MGLTSVIPSQEVAERDCQGIGRIVRLGGLSQAEEPGYHRLDLLFRRPAEAGELELHLERGVTVEREPDRGEEDHPSRLGHGDRGLGVLGEVELLHRQLIRAELLH
jgi:hypothetical protein